MIEQANKTIQTYLNKKLTKHGWQWNLVSTLSEGIVRVQIAPKGEGFEHRIKCFNAETLEEAATAAEKYILEHQLKTERNEK